jgi:hypothetical protein
MGLAPTVGMHKDWLLSKKRPAVVGVPGNGASIPIEKSQKKKFLFESAFIGDQ